MSYNGGYDYNSRGGDGRNYNYDQRGGGGYGQQMYGDAKRSYESSGDYSYSSGRSYDYDKSSYGGGDRRYSVGGGDRSYLSGASYSSSRAEPSYSSSGDRGFSSSGGGYGGAGYNSRGRGDYDDRSRGGYNNSGYGRSSGSGDRVGSAYASSNYGYSATYEQDRAYSSRDRGSGYGGSYSRNDKNDNAGRAGYDDNSRGRRDRSANGNYNNGGRGDNRNSVGYGGYGGGNGGGDRRRDNGGGGRYGGRGERSSGVGDIDGCGYEKIGDCVMDPRKQELWTGRVDPLDVKSDDPDLQQETKLCRRPGFGKDGKLVKVHVNYFGISLDAAPREIFKYHVDVERTPLPEDQGHSQQPRRQQPDRPLHRALVRRVINAALQQYAEVFAGTRVVHDGMSALFSPAKLEWNSRDFYDVNPPPPSTDGAQPAQQPPHQRRPNDQRDRRPPRAFIVKMKLAETIQVGSLTSYYKDPDEKVMPVLQALDVVARHLGAQRLISVGRNFFTMKQTHELKGGKELCWGYHQAIRVGDRKLLMNVDQAATVFYAPGELMTLAMAALKVRSARDVHTLSERDMRSLARAFRKLEVTPTHRNDRKRPIFGVSPDRADRTMVDIKGETLSVADYFLRKHNIRLQYPTLPLVNVGSKHAGRETWLPIELCQVAPGQRCPNINDLDTAEIIRQTSQPPHVRRENIIKQIHQAGFENDPYLAAFGVKITLQPEITESRVLDPPDVQYANMSERPSGGQWNLRDKRFVSGATLRNWGVVVDANVNQYDVENFVENLVDMGSKSGLVMQSRNPPIIDRSASRGGGDVEELMKICFGELEMRGSGPPQLLVVIKQDKGSFSYGQIKRMSDTVLGIPSQCIVASNVRNTKPTFCANVCLKINMKLNGKNSVLREPLPLVSSAPTIIMGADVSHPRSGMGSRPSIASVAACMDAYSAKYIARVAAQKASSDFQRLPHMLRELFMSFYMSTSRQPERVIYYRDGVSEGRFFDILQSEMRALRRAFKMLSEDYNPTVTFVVVNKRHHMRAFAVNQRDADRKGNVVPGTVIDTNVIDPHRFDFFLYGHSGIQGTSVPCHYTVLHDENRMTADELQRLTYHLGYTFSRCTRSVSFATPVYYAHLAAGRARFFLHEGSSDAGSTMSTNVSDSSSFDFAAVHQNLVDCMFFT